MAKAARPNKRATRAIKSGAVSGKPPRPGDWPKPGAFLHDGLLWIPNDIDDCRIGVAYAPLDEVLADISGAS